jgi:hypothetical protein
MPIGSSKLGVLGAGLVPGGTETFNAPGTFSIPPGVKKVSITGTGGSGNPGTSGTAGNPGENGIGGGGGGGGAFGGGFYTTFGPNPWTSVRGGRSFQYGPCGNFTPLVPPACNRPNSQPGHGNTGPSGGGGSAGSAGCAGNAGQSSSGLGNTFPGGAAGNAGNAGGAGTGGGGGPGGFGGNPFPGTPGATGQGGAGGTGGGAGSPAAINRPGPANCIPAPERPITVHPGGGGGGGAGATNDGATRNLACVPWNPSLYFYGGIGGTSTGFCASICNQTPCGRSLYKPQLGPSSTGGTGGGRGRTTPNFTCRSYAGTFAFGGGQNPASLGGSQPTRATVCTNSAGPASETSGYRVGEGGSACPAGFCQPSYPLRNLNITRTNPATRSGGGGAAGFRGNSPVNPGPPYGAAQGGGGGGGRGGAGNAGGAGGAGGTGGAGTPATFNCVPVTPGGTEPITVASPGGQIVISWNPQ